MAEYVEHDGYRVYMSVSGYAVRDERTGEYVEGADALDTFEQAEDIARGLAEGKLVAPCELCGAVVVRGSGKHPCSFCGAQLAPVESA